jgi:hypothetical protein
MKLLLSAAICSFVALAACGGDGTNPFMDETDGGDTGSGDTGGGDTGGDTGGNNTGNTFDTGGGGVPPGVDGPVSTPNNAIVRYEELNDNGGGRAEKFSYNPDDDTFSVDNLAFDGEGPYTRVDSDNPISSLGSYAVYNAEVTVPDSLDGDAIAEIESYRAIVGISNVPNEPTVEDPSRTSFAIVRTGGYNEFGFGGFVYQRSGDVVMPTTGQARFDGDYAGMRVFDGAGGLEFTAASLRIDLDFDDPTDATAGVKGLLYNRVAYDLNGDVIASNNGTVNTLDGILPLPNIGFVLDGDNGNVSVDGELNGSLAANEYIDESGNAVTYESGTYYAILAGDTTQPDGGEIVGVLVIDSTDPRFDGVTAQETGGFILYRDDAATPIP